MCPPWTALAEITPALRLSRARRFPLRYDDFKSQLKIGTATVVLMVMLRMGLGCHFLYEGVWKMTHPEFSAESFLTMAKGPAAPIFHAMIYDIDGLKRLKIERGISADSLLTQWRKVRDSSEERLVKDYVDRLKRYEAKKKKQKGELSAEDRATVASLEKKIRSLTKPFQRGTEPILWKCEDQLDTFLKKNERSMLAYFATPSGERESSEKVEGWLKDLGRIQTEYVEQLTDFGKKDEAARKAIVPSLDKLAPVIDESKAVEELVAGNRLRNPKGDEILKVADFTRAEKFYEPCKKLKAAVFAKYGLNDDQKYHAEGTYRQYKNAFKTLLADNQDDIAVYFKALKRLEDHRAAGNNGAAHQKQRLYDEKQKLRKEVGVWLKELEASESGFQDALAGMLTSQQAARGALPVPWKRIDYINFAVTYGLTAIGLCLLLGLFTRPAALGGACFMISVILTQPAWPTIVPHDPPVVGHALLINKDFIEMLALFMLATTAVGRWAGLDYFVENYVVSLWGKLQNKSNPQEDKS